MTHSQRLERQHDVTSRNYNMKFHETKIFIAAGTATRYNMASFVTAYTVAVTGENQDIHTFAACAQYYTH